MFYESFLYDPVILNKYCKNDVNATAAAFTYLKDELNKRSKPYKKIIFNYPATIVIWNDGTKTVVKCQEGESYDKEKGVAMCFMKKFLGNKSNFNNVFRDCGALNEEDEDGTD